MGLPTHPCGARLSNGRGRCRAHPAKGRRRCRFHGGASTGPKTFDGRQRTIAAMVAGRKRWLERMQKAKQLGWIDKIPTGRRRPGVRKAPTKGIARARRIALCGIDELSPPEATKLTEDKDKSLPELWAETVCDLPDGQDGGAAAAAEPPAPSAVKPPAEF